MFSLTSLLKRLGWVGREPIRLNINFRYNLQEIACLIKVGDFAHFLRFLGVKVKNILVNLSVVLAVMSSCAGALYGARLPENIKSLLDMHKSELRELLVKWQEPRMRGIFGARIAYKDWLRGYVIKHGITRVFNADKLRETIQRRKLHLIDVPHKYVYQVFGEEGDCTDQNSLVIAEEIVGRTGKGIGLDLEQTQQLWSAAMDASHYDMHCANYVVADNGKVYIIDTDDGAMPSQNKSFTLTLDWLFYGNRLHDGSGIRMNPEKINDPATKLELSLYSKWKNYNDDAYAWVSSMVQRRETLRKTIRNGFIVSGIVGVLSTANRLYQSRKLKNG